MANAGMVIESEFLSLDASDWDRTIALNLTGAFHTLQLAARADEDATPRERLY